MATRLEILGTTDWVDGEVLYADDLNTTLDQIYNKTNFRMSLLRA